MRARTQLTGALGEFAPAPGDAARGADDGETIRRIPKEPGVGGAPVLTGVSAALAACPDCLFRPDLTYPGRGAPLLTPRSTQRSTRRIEFSSSVQR
jgi:hypothetical protein